MQRTLIFLLRKRKQSGFMRVGLFGILVKKKKNSRITKTDKNRSARGDVAHDRSGVPAYLYRAYAWRDEGRGSAAIAAGDTHSRRHWSSPGAQFRPTATTFAAPTRRRKSFGRLDGQRVEKKKTHTCTSNYPVLYINILV